MSTIYRHIISSFLLSLLSLGVHAGAETTTATFDQGLPEGWTIVGSITNSSDRARSGKGLFSSAKADKTNYIVTSPIEGDIEFWARSYNTRGYGYVTLYTVNDDNTLGDKINEFRTANVDRAPVSFQKFTYTLPSAGRVAVDLYWSCIDDFSYTPAIEISGPALKITGYENGSSYDFGGEQVKAGTTCTFTLTNPGAETLTISSVNVTGGYTITEGSELTSIAAKQSASLTIATPPYDAQGSLTIVSDDANSPYTINLSSTLKPAAPQLETDIATIDFGVVTGDMTQTINFHNSGDADLQATIASDNAKFTVSPSGVSLAPGESSSVVVTYNHAAADYGKHTGTITITHNGGDAVAIPVSATVKNPNIWTEQFDGNTLPDGWEAGDKWTFADGVARASYDYSNRNSQLITPSLVAQTGETLSFNYRATANYVTINITGSKDGGDFTELAKISTDRMSDFKTYTISGLEAGTWRFCFTNDYYELDDFEGLVLNTNAPRLEIAPATAANFGKVSSTPEPKAYTVSNIGSGKMSVTLTTDSDDFIVSPTAIEDIEPEQPATFYISFNYNASNPGQKTANITVTPTYSETDRITIEATANAIDPNLWMEDFEEGSLPATWDNQGAWEVTNPTFPGSNGTMMANVRSAKPVALTTPRLHAAKNDILSFYIGMQYDDEPLVIEYSTDDKASWQPIDPSKPSYNQSGQLSFTAPDEAYYYLRFTATYAMLDDFVGFKPAPREFELCVGSVKIPAEIYQYVDCSASVTVKEMVGKATVGHGALFIGNDKVADSESQEIAPFGTTTYSFSFNDTELRTDATAHIEIYYNEYTLKTPDVKVDIVAAQVFDEGLESEFTEGLKPAAVIKYTPINGWNTIAMPFVLNDEILEKIFGYGYKAYEFRNVQGNEIIFRECSNFAAGYPYLIYAENPEAYRQCNIIINDVDIQTTTAKYDEHDGIRFQASFAPGKGEEQDACYLVSPFTLNLLPFGADAGQNAYHAYFILDNSVTNLPKVVVYGNNGQISTGLETIETEHRQAGNIYDLSGRRQSATNPKGIYIIDARKVLCR